MLALIGVYECTVDAKGRLMLPAAFKKQLAASMAQGFIIKRSVFHKCLEFYPMTEWEHVAKEVNQLNRFVKKHNDFIRMFTAGIKAVEADGNGRILIPGDLLRYAGIRKNIVLASAMNMIEIWDTAQYEKSVNESENDFAALAEEIMGNRPAEQ